MSGGNAGSGSGVVMADAQFGVATVVKPFAGFEAVYQGTAVGARPIAFPGGRDPKAGQPGYSPQLIAGIPAPLGSRLHVWIPTAVSFQLVTVYEYTFHWRMRSLQDFRNPAGNIARRAPYHLRQQSDGAPDSSVPAPRFVIPAANDTIIYEPTEPANFSPAVQNVHTQSYAIGSAGGSTNPLFADGTEAIFQQGVLDPGVVGAQVAGDPIFSPLWMDVAGDELVITVTRPAGGDLNWDFAGADLPFSNIYGTGNGTHEIFPDVGIYLFFGTNP